MAISLQDLIQANKDSLTVLSQTVARLKRLRIGAAPNDLNRINAELANADELQDHLQTINAHLQAAGVSIQTPMNATEEADFLSLSAKLQAAIRQSTIVSATLSSVQDLLDAVRDIAISTNNHV